MLKLFLIIAYTANLILSTESSARPTCGENEIVSYFNSQCQKQYCFQLEESTRCTIYSPNSTFMWRCICKDGYLRNDKGTCVPVNECPPLTCTENERVSNCADGGCQKKYCSQLEKRTICIDPVSCRKGCVCKDGYLRNEKLVCVPINECPRSTCGENEIFSYCVDRGCENNYCSQLDQHNRPREILDCMRGCICKHGYLRNDKGACVPISEIPHLTCGENEIYLCCHHGCKNRYSSHFPHNGRRGVLHCRQGCICKDNYLKNDKGVCVPVNESQYTKTGKYDETTKSIKKREALTVTENMKNIDTTTTPSEHANYIAMITPFQATPTCTENEIVSHCVNGGCGKKHCSQLEEYTMCIDPLYCMKGCICKDGYLRNDQGVCVPINECPRPTCGENEIFSYCMDRGCENNYCSQLHQHNEEILHCRRGCICKDGYMLNDKEACVPISESLKS